MSSATFGASPCWARSGSTISADATTAAMAATQVWFFQIWYISESFPPGDPSAGRRHRASGERAAASQLGTAPSLVGTGIMLRMRIVEQNRGFGEASVGPYGSRALGIAATYERCLDAADTVFFARVRGRRDVFDSSIEITATATSPRACCHMGRGHPPRPSRARFDRLGRRHVRTRAPPRRDVELSPRRRVYAPCVPRCPR